MTRADAPSAFAAGDAVQTPLGKGVVREARNRRRVLVEVHGRSLIFEAAQLTAVRPAQRRTLDARSRPAQVDDPESSAPSHRTHSSRAAVQGGSRRPRQVDLHGLTVEAALERVDQALDRAMQDDVDELHVVHGRSGGRLRQAVHRRLAVIPSVRAFGLDPRNAGVTIVHL